MKKFWFRKRKGLFTKELGWGYIPISWEGTVLYLVLFALILFFFFYFNLTNATTWEGIYFTITLLVLLIVFNFVAKSKTKN